MRGNREEEVTEMRGNEGGELGKIRGESMKSDC